MSLKSKLEVISDLMSELMQNMEPGAEDLDERLGRKKPVGIEIEVESKEMPEEEMADMEHEGSEDMSYEMEEEDESKMSPLKRLNRIKKMG